MFVFIQGQDPQPIRVVDAYFREGRHGAIRHGDLTVRGRSGRRYGSTDHLAGAAAAAAVAGLLDGSSVG